MMGGSAILLSLGLGAVLAAPLAVLGLMAVRRWRGLAERLTGWSALPALIAAVAWPRDAVVSWNPMLLGTRLGIDETGAVFLFFTAALWLASSIFALDYLRNDSRRTAFFAFYLLAFTGNIGLILAQDIASFFAFFTLMSFASYALVIHDRKSASLRAGRVYLVLVVVGEVLLFSGMVALVALAGSTDFAVLRTVPADGFTYGLLIAGFGIKVGALPLHVWLPLAHPAAPAPASAVLSGAMIKAGLLGWLRVLPLGITAVPAWGEILIWLGLGAAFYGVVAGLFQRDPKTLLAYSSISQMGALTVAVGLGLSAPDSWPLLSGAVAFYALHHAFAKSALFLGVGVIHQAGASQIRLAHAGVVVAALVLAGLPFTSGAIAKTVLKSGLSGAVAGPLELGAWLSLAAVGTALLMSRLVVLLLKATPHSGRASGWQVGSWLALTLGGSVVAWLWPTDSLATHEASTLSALWTLSWPLVLGAGVGAAVAGLTKRLGYVSAQLIPPGDLLQPIEKALRRLNEAALSYGRRWGDSSLPDGLARLPDIAQIEKRMALAEAWLAEWPVVGALFVFILVALYLLLLF